MTIADLIVPGLRPAGAPSSSASAGTARTASWVAWGLAASVTVTDPAALPAARRIVGRHFAATEKAAARFRRDAEVHKLYRAGGRPITISPVLAELVASALIVAERTGGDVDPTVGAAVTVLESDYPANPSASGDPQRSGWFGRSEGRDRRDRRDRSGLPACGSRPTGGRPAAGWDQVRLEGRRLLVPAGTTLDLTATATAAACDRAAARVRERLDVGVLVRLGGDAASAGPAPELEPETRTDPTTGLARESGWLVPVEDRAGHRHTEVLLPAGAGLATSHLTSRYRPESRRRGQTTVPGQFVDPRTGLEPAAIWRMASAIGFSSLEAATYTAAAMVRGPGARNWLVQLGIPARLVTVHDDVLAVGSWSAHLPSDRINPQTAHAADDLDGTDSRGTTHP